MPAYIVAYAYTDALQFAGPLQTALREAFDWRRGDYWFPEIRSVLGGVFVFTVVLYPYVYLLARTAFLARTAAMIDAARSLGLTAWQTWWRVNIPLARPAIAAGALLALMETLADYGASVYFGLQTFTTSIYRAWFSMGDRMAASQLAGVLLLLVLGILALERAGAPASLRPPPASGRRRVRCCGVGGRGGHWRFALCPWFSVSSCRCCCCCACFCRPGPVLRQCAICSGWRTRSAWRSGVRRWCWSSCWRWPMRRARRNAGLPRRWYAPRCG
jgi:iron(III) transport system permease protein